MTQGRKLCRRHTATGTCSVDGCVNKMHSRTLCNTHYSQHRKAGTLDQFPNAVTEAMARPTRQRPKAKKHLWAAAECLEDGCEVPPIARNLCGKHYQLRTKAGTLPPRIRVKLAGVPCVIARCESKAVARARCQAHASLHRRYGLTNEQMESLPAACEVCGAAEKLHVDHDHATGAYRGVLCQSCNLALGALKDDPQRIRTLAQYVERTAD